MQVEVRSCKMEDLMLLDLPGIVGGSLPGQPADMPAVTRRLVKKHLLCPDTLVLAVASAPSLVHNSPIYELLHAAGKADRALGVITMLDKCDAEGVADVKFKMERVGSELPPLGAGYVLAINRSSWAEAQAEREGRKKPTIDDAAVTEAAWFGENMPELSGRTGIAALVGTVLGMVEGYVRDRWAPAALRKLAAEMERCKGELIELGVPVGANDAERLDMLRDILGPAMDQLARLYRTEGEDEIEGAIRECFASPLPNGDRPINSRLRFAGLWSLRVSASADSAKRAVRSMLSGAKDGAGKWVSPILRQLQRFLVTVGPSHGPPLCADRFEHVWEAVVAIAAEFIAKKAAAMEAAAEARLNVLEAVAALSDKYEFSAATTAESVRRLKVC